MKSIHLQDSFEDTLTLYSDTSLNKSRAVYTFLLILALGLFFAFPWLQIKSIATSPAVLLPLQKPTQIIATTSGEMHLFGPAENRLVSQGDTLFTLRTENLKKNQVVVSPTDGYIRNLKGCEGGCRAIEGQVIMEILPEPGPVVKCYLTADQIISIQPEEKVQFQIQSSQNQTKRFFNGKVKTISPSLALSSNGKKDVYEILCSIDMNQGNERSLKMKSGMTLIARFRLARRSAFDILMKDPGSIEINPS